MTHREVSPHTFSLQATGLHAPIRNTGGSPSTPALLLLGLTKLLVIKRLLLLVVGLNERIISPIGKGEAISIAEVAIDRRRLTFPLDVRLLGPLIVIEQFFLSHHASFPSTLVLASL